MIMDLPAGVTFRPSVHVDKLTARQRRIVKELFPARDNIGRLDGSTFRFHADQAQAVVDVLDEYTVDMKERWLSGRVAENRGTLQSARRLLAKVENAIGEAK